MPLSEFISADLSREKRETRVCVCERKGGKEGVLCECCSKLESNQYRTSAHTRSILQIAIRTDVRTIGITAAHRES